MLSLYISVQVVWLNRGVDQWICPVLKAASSMFVEEINIYTSQQSLMILIYSHNKGLLGLGEMVFCINLRVSLPLELKMTTHSWEELRISTLQTTTQLISM